jgi:hypothetical protein
MDVQMYFPPCIGCIGCFYFSLVCEGSYDLWCYKCNVSLLLFKIVVCECKSIVSD